MLNKLLFKKQRRKYVNGKSQAAKTWVKLGAITVFMMILCGTVASYAEDTYNFYFQKGGSGNAAPAEVNVNKPAVEEKAPPAPAPTQQPEPKQTNTLSDSNERPWGMEISYAEVDGYVHESQGARFALSYSATRVLGLELGVASWSTRQRRSLLAFGDERNVTSGYTGISPDLSLVITPGRIHLGGEQELRFAVLLGASSFNVFRNYDGNTSLGYYPQDTYYTGHAGFRITYLFAKNFGLTAQVRVYPAAERIFPQAGNMASFGISMHF